MSPRATEFLLSGLWEWDLTRNTISIADTIKEICDLQHVHPSLIETIVQLFRQRPDQKRLLETINRARKEPFTFDLRMQITTSAGLKKLIRVMGQSVIADKQIVRLYGFIQDIDHTSEVVNQMKQALKDIAYIQSHELRKPVASILGLIHLFQLDDFKIGPEEIMMLNTCALELDGQIRTIMEFVGSSDRSHQ